MALIPPLAGYITGSDTPSYDAAPETAIQGALAMQAIDNILESASAMQIMVAFDSCFSGSVFDSKIFTTPPLKIEEDAIVRNLLRRPIISYITAGKENQTIPANSLFARAFLSAINGEADYWGNGFVTGPDIGIYAYNEIYRQTSGANTPLVGNSKSDDRNHSEFVFAVPSGVRKAVQVKGSVGFFDFDRYNLTPEIIQAIQGAAQMYRVLSGKVFITGFTDREGRSFEENVRRSLREINAVANVLSALGVARADMVFNPRGDKYQRIGDDNDPRNRRVEIVVP
jgi:outer membrane protein OmpA-like peptidoglycan-associated protein